MDPMNKGIGFYEVAYANIAHYLLTEREAKKQKTMQLKHPSTFLDKVVNCMIGSYSISIENLKLFMIDPLKATFAKSEVYWGMLALSPEYSNIIGTVFHQPISKDNEIETMCGLLMNPCLIHLLYMCESSEFVHGVSMNFTMGNASTILEKVDNDIALGRLFNMKPRFRSLATELVTIVNDELLKCAPKDPLT